MPNYKKLYLMLFSKMTDILEEIKETQIKAEEEIMSSPEPEIQVICCDDLEKED